MPGTLTLQFLAWVAARPRSYAETMEAWRSTCPRMSIWEDALGDGLVALECGNGSGMSHSGVALTAQGWAVLNAAGPAAAAPQRRRA
jgi:hypothetical protein